MKLNRYRFTFDGMALGGEMVVLAENPQDATKAAERRLKEYAPDKDPYEDLDLEIERFHDGRPDEVVDLSTAQVVHFWDGDY